MKLDGQRVLLTGASGGIGVELAARLLDAGARVTLVGRDEARLTAVAAKLPGARTRTELLVADLQQPNAPERLAQHALAIDRVDLLVHCAGISAFENFAATEPATIDALWRTNVIAPMRLTRALLPAMLRQGQGRIVAVGSIFGSIAFPYFATYSATKFALRGFCEALRREIAGSGVGVTYVAPRYTKTALNDGPVASMAEAVKMAQDDPADVARWIVRTLERDRDEAFFGWPERLFVRINQLLPRLVDGSLIAQRDRMKPFLPDPRSAPAPAVTRTDAGVSQGGTTR